VVDARDQIIANAKNIRAVFDDVTRDAAIAAARDLKQFRLDADKARTAAKAPINTLAKKVEALMAGLRPLLDASSGVMFVTETYVSRPDYFS
jgi:hypothetical protein